MKTAKKYLALGAALLGAGLLAPATAQASPRHPHRVRSCEVPPAPRLLDCGCRTIVRRVCLGYDRFGHPVYHFRHFPAVHRCHRSHRGHGHRHHRHHGRRDHHSFYGDHHGHWEHRHHRRHHRARRPHLEFRWGI